MSLLHALAEPRISTKVKSLGQVAICMGCCCGQTEKGHPYIPRDELKAIWKQEQLNRTVQLTISGCLGPCDLTNVIMLHTPDTTIWLGDLTTSDFYVLLEWVRNCKEAAMLLPLPPALADHRFERFPGKSIPDCQLKTE